VRNRQTGEPWERDTMVMVWSATKGMSALARAYGVFATGGRELGFRPETLQALMAPAVPPPMGSLTHA
jgi:hypothetical protein